MKEDISNCCDKLCRDEITRLNFIVNEINTQLEKINKILKPYLRKNTREDIDRLEQIFAILELHKNGVRNGTTRQFKCPVCDGNAVRIYLNTDVNNDNFKSQVQENKCHACEGKGIVWG